ncbi:FAD-dependent oxidoreductase [uncultured Mailhella sp.]|uniref:FAD-dependent oxidoreductase n=1 Tax=uncultured Mailhella sp. TaxID=1981031 RepID=UPI00261CC5A5|nr:FAD-dependent oxidoreductase [uncultured Mailhella sp.]
MPPRYSREITMPIVMGDSLREQFRTSPCEHFCPAGNSIQKMQALVEKGDFCEALRYLRAKNPFPGVTGRVCPHFCQSNCNRAGYDACVNTRALERAVYDYAPHGAAQFKRRPATGRSVGIIGGGPAGLTAAYFLALLGHDVLVYEANPVLGGMARYGVPDFRLPRDVVDRELGWVLEAGVRARVNTVVGRDISFAGIRAAHDAVIVATGMPKENSLPIPGAECAVKAVDFLREASLGLRPSVGRRVVVMGGGGVGFDAAFVARRLGAEEVHVICLEKAGEMRAPEEDLVQAAEEGIAIHNSCTMSAIRTSNGKAAGVDYFEVQECRFDEKGRLTLVPVPGGEHHLDCDTVIFAVGMKTDLGFMAGTDVTLSPRNWIVVDKEQASSAAGLFAAGEVSSGPGSIAGAIGAGRRAAFGVHAWLTGEKSRVYVIGEGGVITARDDLAGDAEPYVVPREEIYGILQYEKTEAQKPACVNHMDFTENCAGYTAEQAVTEAARCMHCGHCKGCGTCVDDCPGYVLELRHLENGSDRPEVAHGDECWHCANCRTSCPTGAIGFRFPLRMQV